MGWDSTVLAIRNISLDTNFLSGLVHNNDGFEWWLSVVYGPQGDEAKIAFLEEPRARRMVCLGQWMLLGHLNMILRASDKNNNNLRSNIINKFRSFVDEHELKELYMHRG